MLEEAQRLHANLRNEQNIAQQRLNSIRDSVAGLQVDSDSLNAAQIKLRALQREADAAREVCEAFFSRYKETAQPANAQAASRSLSLAGIPTGPSFPRTTANYPLALLRV